MPLGNILFPVPTGRLLICLQFNSDAPSRRLIFPQNVRAVPNRYPGRFAKNPRSSPSKRVDASMRAGVAPSKSLSPDRTRSYSVLKRSLEVNPTRRSTSRQNADASSPTPSAQGLPVPRRKAIAFPSLLIARRYDRSALSRSPSNSRAAPSQTLCQPASSGSTRPVPHRVVQCAPRLAHVAIPNRRCI